MFVTQIYGTILGGFINYAVMISIVSGNRALLVDGNGNASWSGATMQAFNSNATSWALASYLYKAGRQYSMVPIGIVVGGAAVVVHRLFYQVFNPRPFLFYLKLKLTHIPFLVCTKDREIRCRRGQHGTIHSICWIYPIQPKPDLCSLQLDSQRYVCSVLPPELSTPHLQGLLISHRRRL